MARTELEIKKQKRKAKKRKHETQAAGSDDEVADKSVIVEEQQVASESQMEQDAPRKVKASKRKQQVEQPDVIKEKRSKSTDDNKDAEDDPEDMPTADQLAEAAKPENSNAIVTVRQKKKQKHLQRLEEKKYQSSDKEAKRNEEYLVKWRDCRQDWKFVKLRQISIQQNAFNEQKLNADIWAIALEYLAASKGASKTTVTKLAQDAIEQMDKQCELLTDEAERQAILDSTRYQRARNLLQSFD
ncbi:uncharacterized protein C7orf50 homolog [Drosophila grimshawi]|uniref:GH15004 n=1 Tax=Drosophila grimshawi TaxID=7222 RepID=B4J0I2_DROGR|nr:uncharacterized protein C7orf50 homolog [Drosophila grimshawi]EDV96818.1 GH15004 [Drosophila grimshawi]